MTSMPIICTTTPPTNIQDTMLLVLYGANMDLIHGLIAMFSKNITQSHPELGNAIIETLTPMTATASQGLDYARAVLLLLLNVDVIGKRWVCEGFPNAKIGPLCGHKAPGFFTVLANEVVPQWQRNEIYNVQDLVEKARSAYIHT
jgi:hypothetical protein